MAKRKYKMIQMFDMEAALMLENMAKADMRSYGKQTAWLIKKEFERRKSEADTHAPSMTENPCK